jgi:hypothetical protein
MMNADGTSPHRVTDVDGFGQAIWLPDSKSMLISREHAVLNLDLVSGRTTPVAGADGRSMFLVDSQGKTIAFYVSEGGATRVASAPVAGGTPRIVFADGDEAYHPFFSPSGRWFYFQKTHKNLFRIPGPAQDWKSARPEPVTDFKDADLYIDGPKTSADGSRLFYARGKTTGGIEIVQRSKPAKAQ